jgi:hypothetical protein
MSTPEQSIAVWRKSTRSSGNGNCVEFCDRGVTVAVRDTKDRRGPELQFTATSWSTFMNSTKSGSFDRA